MTHRFEAGLGQDYCIRCGEAEPMHRLDVVATTGGKATVETVVPKDGMAKIRLKGGPKHTKSAAGPTGERRLQQRVNALLLAAARLEKKGGPDVAYASRLREALQAFNAAEFARSGPLVDVEALIR